MLPFAQLVHDYAAKRPMILITKYFAIKLLIK